jgi:hypothetical protein
MFSWLTAIVILAAILHWLRLVPFLKFAWHCFLQPIGSGDQKTRLDKVSFSALANKILISSPVLSRASCYI